MSTTVQEDVIGPDGTKFFTKTWLPSPSTPTIAVVLFVHGFVEHIRRYDHVFPLYAEKGIAVFAYDQRGFGQTAFYTSKHSQGQTTWMKQFSDLDFFTSHIRSKFPSPLPLYLMGHSMGGAIVLGYPTRKPLLPNFKTSNFKGIISTSPLIRQSPKVKAPPIIVKLGSIIGKLLPNLPLNAQVKPQDTCRDPEIQKSYSEDKLCKQIGSFGGVGSMLIGGESLLKTGYKDWPTNQDQEGLPLLICHGESDKVTDHEASKGFVDKLKHQVGVKDVTYKGFQGYYHEMQNEPGQDKLVFINYVIDWILSRTPLNNSNNNDSTTTQPQAQPTLIDTTNTPAIQVSPASPIVEDPTTTPTAAAAAARDSKL
ncbi:hypothetical protein JCM3765_000038 [Sporobolomyces pararoseus]